MTSRQKYLFRDRKDAFSKLASNFDRHILQDCCVIAMSNGALPIAIPLSRRLSCDLIFMPSIRIKDPSDFSRSIGAVGFDHAVVENVERDLPQDLLYRNVRRLRSELLSRYPGVHSPISFDFQSKTVIIVNDVIQTHTEILCLLKVIRRQQPERIIVTSPAITHSVAQIVIKHADATTFIHIANEGTIQRTYLNSNTLTDEEVVGLLAVTTRSKQDSKGPTNPRSKMSIAKQKQLLTPVDTLH